MLSDDDLRDQAAIHALQEMVAHWTRDSGHLAPFPAEANARQAYEIADALVAERRRRSEA